MPDVISQQSAKQQSYIPISVKTLHPAQASGVSLYSLDEVENKFRLYRDRDVSIDADDIEKLLDRGQSTLYVEASEHTAYQQHLRESLDTIVSDELLDVERRFTSLNEVMRDVLGKSFNTGNTEETIRVCKNLSQHSVDLICHADVNVGDLFGVMYHDYHTFTHSANVAYYCVILAKALGIRDAESLREISIGGLLHDLGKLEIPASILTKPGRLTDEEFEIIRAHPTSGLLKLRGRDDLSFGQLMMAYQHHERLNGTGYPVRSAGDQIHEWAKICAIADVFEALTSNRPYRAGMSKKTAFEIMDRDAESGALDGEMLKCWKAIVATT